MFKKEKDNVLITARKIEEQQDLIEYLTEQNDDKEREIRNLKEEKIELEHEKLSSDLELAKKNNIIKEKEEKIELLKERIEYLESLVENYQKMPDLKNMVDNLAELTSPSIENLTKILKESNFDNLVELEKKIEKISGMVGDLCHFTMDRGPRTYSL